MLGQAWVLTVEDRDIGYGLVYFRHSIDHGGRIAILDDLWVTVDQRGQGLGARLLKADCEDLQAMGARAVPLGVDPANEIAIALYSRFSFTKIGTALCAKSLVQGKSVVAVSREAVRAKHQSDEVLGLQGAKQGLRFPKMARRF